MEANKIIITGGATRIGAAIAKKLSGPNIEILIHYNRSKSKAEFTIGLTSSIKRESIFSSIPMCWDPWPGKTRLICLGIIKMLLVLPLLW